jgi:hypothetical protein
MICGEECRLIRFVEVHCGRNVPLKKDWHNHFRVRQRIAWHASDCQNGHSSTVGADSTGLLQVPNLCFCDVLFYRS